MLRKFGTKLIVKHWTLFRCITIALIVCNSFSAKCITTWEKIYVQNSTDCFRCVREVPAGGYVLAGYTANFSQNDTDGIILRLNNNGDTLWSFIYNGPNNHEDLFYKVVPTTDGGFIVAGYSKSFSGSDDALYLKLNSSGHLAWINHWGGSGIEHPQDIIQLSDGTYAMCGYTTSSPAHYYDAFLLRIDASGAIMSNKLYGGNNYDDANSILELPDEGFLMGGQSNNNFYLNRTDATGNLLWTNSFGTSGIDNIECINFAQGGNGFVLVGTTDGSGNGQEDAYFARTDSGGTIIWSKLYGSSLNDGFHRVEQTSDGGYVAVGTSDQGSMTNPNMWLVKLDSAGVVSWSNLFGGNDHDHGYSGQQTSDGGYILTGHSHSYVSNTHNEDGLIEKTNATGQVSNKMSWTEVTNLISPVVTTCGSANATVKVEFANYGNATISNVPITVEITGAITQTITQTYNSSLGRNAVATLTLSTTVDMSGGGTFNFHCYTGNPHDVIPPRNYFNKSITVGGNAPPAITPGSHCGPGTVTLAATSPTSIQWYTTSTGGSSVGSGSNFTTPYIAATTTYYAQTGGSCQSSRVPVIATVTAGLPAPVVTGASRCNSGTLSISANASDPVNWYSSNTSTNVLATGSGFTTPSISTTTTYYAQSDNGSCTSNRVAVVASILNPPATPVLTSGSHCGPGTVMLTGNSPVAIEWYDASSGGNLVGNGNSFTTSSISSTTTFYALANNGTCASSLVPVAAVISSPPADPVTTNGNRCGSGTVQLSATSPVSVKWFDVPSGGSQLGSGLTFTTPSVSTTTTFYAVSDNGCQGNRIPAIATVNPLPAAPVTTGNSRCGTGTLTLNASSTNTIKWFSASSGGTSLATGNSFTTPSISSTTTYYAASDDGCLSVRAAAVAVVHSIPVMTNIVNGSHCGSGTVNLSVSSANTVSWYDSSVAGNVLQTGLTFTTPSLTVTTTYYVSAASANCTSARSAVVATISSPPSSPTVIAGERCGAGTVVLHANGTGTLNWYNVQTGGSVLGTGAAFTTPSISTTTTYYAQVDNGCLSSRVPVFATINPIPVVPVVTDTTRCGSGTIDLIATSGNSVEWYAASTGGSILFTGSVFTTPVINSTTTFFALSDNGNCSSIRVPVTITINQLPADPAIIDSSRCGEGVVDLHVASADSIVWFDSSQAAVGNGIFYLTPFLSTTTLYYVQAFNSLCAGNLIPIHAEIKPAPAINLGADSIITSLAAFNIDAGPGYPSYMWTTGETTQSITVSGNGDYCVMVTAASGCNTIDCQFVQFMVGINETEFSSINSYPSPASDFIRFGENINDAKLRMYDLTGKMVLSVDDFSSNNTIDVSRLINGCYFVNITGNDFRYKSIIQIQK
jgi:hypothetical protein